MNRFITSLRDKAIEPKLSLNAGVLLGLILVSIQVQGCSPDWKLEVESNTQWYATYGGVSGAEWTTSSQSGSGNETIDLPDDERVCCIVVQEGNGRVKAELKNTNGGPFDIFGPNGRDGETNVEGGSIEMCSDGTIP